MSSAGGIPATEFYTNEDPGITVNIYESQSTYKIPGPTLWSGAKGSVAQAPATIESYAPWVTGTTSAVEGYEAQPTAYAASTSSEENGGGKSDEATTSTSIGSPPVSLTTMTTIATTTMKSGPSPYSKIQSLIDALPSGALTQAIPVPTGGAKNGEEWGVPHPRKTFLRDGR